MKNYVYVAFVDCGAVRTHLEIRPFDIQLRIQCPVDSVYLYLRNLHGGPGGG